jgi:hypothetical protein
MNRCMITAIVLIGLSAVRMQSAQRSVNPKATSLPDQPYSSTAAPSQAMATSAENRHDRLLEGCVRNANGGLTLTDLDGKVYHLRGDTAQLARHIGQHATVTGAEEQGGASGAAGAQPTFTVKKVSLIASVCAASK